MACGFRETSLPRGEIAKLLLVEEELNLDDSTTTGFLRSEWFAEDLIHIMGGKISWDTFVWFSDATTQPRRLILLCNLVCTHQVSQETISEYVSDLAVRQKIKKYIETRLCHNRVWVPQPLRYSRPTDSYYPVTQIHNNDPHLLQAHTSVIRANRNGVLMSPQQVKNVLTEENKLFVYLLSDPELKVPGLESDNFSWKSHFRRMYQVTIPRDNWTLYHAWLSIRDLTELSEATIDYHNSELRAKCKPVSIDEYHTICNGNTIYQIVLMCLVDLTRMKHSLAQRLNEKKGQKRHLAWYQLNQVAQYQKFPDMLWVALLEYGSHDLFAHTESLKSRFGAVSWHRFCSYKDTLPSEQWAALFPLVDFTKIPKAAVFIYLNAQFHTSVRSAMIKYYYTEIEPLKCIPQTQVADYCGVSSRHQYVSLETLPSQAELVNDRMFTQIMHFYKYADFPNCGVLPFHCLVSDLWRIVGSFLFSWDATIICSIPLREITNGHEDRISFKNLDGANLSYFYGPETSDVYFVEPANANLQCVQGPCPFNVRNFHGTLEIYRDIYHSPFYAHDRFLVGIAPLKLEPLLDQNPWWTTWKLNNRRFVALNELKHAFLSNPDELSVVFRNCRGELELERQHINW